MGYGHLSGASAGHYTLGPSARSSAGAGGGGMMPRSELVRELPDMMSASEGGGGHGKADVVRVVA